MLWLISFSKTSRRRQNTMNGASEMTKELAISLLNSKDVYLTSEGKKALEVILKEKSAYEGK